MRIAPDRPRSRSFSRRGHSSSNKGSTRRVSCFDSALMPTEAIRKRELHAFSVHFSISTSKWIATLARPTTDSSDEKKRCIGFPFVTEREARKFAKAYSPPKMMAGATTCTCCSVFFQPEQNIRAFNCRNCGSQICDDCSTRWGVGMVPKTYLHHSNSATTVRVCKSCDWLSNSFCLALLRGSYDDALLCHATGNINLRCTFANISREAMYVFCSLKAHLFSFSNFSMLALLGSLFIVLSWVETWILSSGWSKRKIAPSLFVVTLRRVRYVPSKLLPAGPSLISP